MKLFDITRMHTLRGAALQGLALGFKLALLYWLVAAILVILRSSLHILSALSWADGLLMTLLASATSVLVGTALFGLILGVLAALVSLVAVLVLRELYLRLRLAGRPGAAAAIGAAVAGGLVVLLSLLLRQAMGAYFSAIWPNGYLFWMGLPGLIFIAACGYLGWQMGNRRSTL